jgi:hypothetical protein
MSSPVYIIVFHDGHWRIGYDGLHIGEYATADLAAEAALKVARSRLAPSPKRGLKTINMAEGLRARSCP